MKTHTNSAYLNSCVVTVALALAACAGPPPSPDASPDASPDVARSDASPEDAARDGSSMDSGGDSSSDSGGDGSLPDSEVDASRDGSQDASLCSMYRGNAAWGAQLVVEPGARLCAVPAGQWSSTSPSETLEQMRQRTLVEMLAKKSTITMPAGSYPLPTASESQAFLLPMCVADLSGPSPVATEASRVTVTRVEGGIGRDDGFYVESTFGLGAGTLGVAVYRPLTSPTIARLSASPVGAHVEGVNARRSNNTLYVSCAIAANTCTNVMVPGVATLRVDEYRWAASPGLGLAVPLRLRATIDGATIDLRSYEAMTGVYGHHAFERSYFFRFANPVRGACGVRVDLGFDANATVQWTACDATPMGVVITAPVAMTSCG